MIRFPATTLPGLAFLLFHPLPLQAGEEPQWRVNGYATLGISHDNSEKAAFIRDLSQRPQNHVETDTSARTDTRFGLQASFSFNPEVELVGQVVLRDQADHHWLRYLDLAFLKWRPLPAFETRLGRVGYDIFLMSDHRNLGYAYPWVRPPTEFYGWIPMYAVDGFDARYTVDDWRLTFQAGHGALGFTMGRDSVYPFHSNRVFSLILSRENGPWRLQAGTSHIIPENDPAPLEPLLAGLGAVSSANPPGIGAEARELARQMRYGGTHVHYTTLGASYDEGNWFLQGELGRIDTSADMVSNGDMGYLGAGYRFGSWMPFLLFSAIRPHGDLYQGQTDWSRIGLADLQTTALLTLNSTRFDQETTSVGLRWDITSRLALKFQLDSIHIHPYGYGLWYSQPTVAERERPLRVNLLSATMDFVF
ncbi:MAG: hypothetical protein HQL56_09075 [Magnetococcales bacterium]|nr:hypothetical protein [Magnetococcales bacterium]